MMSNRTRRDCLVVAMLLTRGQFVSAFDSAFFLRFVLTGLID
jgi:hypothetical protein